jgi:hypothetical protein
MRAALAAAALVVCACSATVPLPESVTPERAEAALCAAKAVQAAGDPRALTSEQIVALAIELVKCAPEDAGAK